MTPRSNNSAPRLVVLDGLPANPGDLSWEPLAALGDLIVHERSSPDELLRHAKGAMALFTNKADLKASTFSALPELRYIVVTATGCNVVDLVAARACGITVTNVPAYSSASVCETTIGFLLALAHRLHPLAAAVAAGAWQRSPDFSFGQRGLFELKGKTLGLIGLGSIGSTVARVALALGMRVVACTPSGRSLPGVRAVSLGELQLTADAISLHCPLTPANRQLVNHDFLCRLRPGAILVNTARGGLVDEAAVTAALHDGRLAGYAADVLTEEPPRHGSPLFAAPNCLLTPHTAWAAKEARQRLIQTVADNFAAFRAGKPANVVN